MSPANRQPARRQPAVGGPGLLAPATSFGRPFQAIGWPLPVGRMNRAERYYGKVSRSFQLAQDIDDGKAAAKFSDGVLELTLPKRAASASKRLAID